MAKTRSQTGPPHNCCKGPCSSLFLNILRADALVSPKLNEYSALEAYLFCLSNELLAKYSHHRHKYKLTIWFACRGESLFMCYVFVQKGEICLAETTNA